MSTNNTTDPILLAAPNDPTAPVVAAVATTTTTATNNSSEHGGAAADNDNEDASEVAVETKGERGKFLPRVKGLLSKENEEVRLSCCVVVNEFRVSFHFVTTLTHSLSHFFVLSLRMNSW